MQTFLLFGHMTHKLVLRKFSASTYIDIFSYIEDLLLPSGRIQYWTTNRL